MLVIIRLWLPSRGNSISNTICNTKQAYIALNPMPSSSIHMLFRMKFSISPYSIDNRATSPHDYNTVAKHLSATERKTVLPSI